MKLYGNEMSSSCVKVMWAAAIVGEDLEFKKTEFTELKTEEHLKLHPAGKIPVADDDGFVLFESNAICKYLCNKKQHELYPTGVKEQAVVDQWIDFTTIHVGGAMSKVAFNRLWAPMLNHPVDENSLREGLNFLEKFLPIADAQLQKGAYLAGNKMTLADISLLGALFYAEKAQVSLEKYAAIMAWLKKLQEESFYKAAFPEQ